jgi:hypothetical protein
MSLTVPLKKLVVEWRFKPELGFYTRMDPVALGLSKDYPDWERSPLTVEVRDKKRHRRLHLSVKRAFFDADGPNPLTEIDQAGKLASKVCRELEITSLTRCGIRQWFAADLDKPFALMVDEVAQRFLNRGPDLTAVLADKVHDVAYTVDYETSEGWRYNLRLGPMLKSQWFQTILYEPGNFEAGDDAVETFEKYQDGFPDQFLFIDVDCYRDDVAADKMEALLTAMRRKSHELVARLIDFAKRK